MIRSLPRFALSASACVTRGPSAFVKSHRQLHRGLRRSAPSMWANPALAAGITLPSSFASFASSATTGPAGMLLLWLAIDVGVQWSGWAVATLLKTEKFYDLLGTGSFALLSVGSLLTASSRAPRQVLATAMVAAWALRLGSYLVMRVMQTGGDSRFDKVKHEPGRFFVYWTLQAVWVGVTLLPLLLLNTLTAGGPARVLWTDAVGVALWGAGFTVEAVADAQKWAFKSDPSNHGRFIDTGLWSLARYPNYGGEMTLWWGVFFLSASALRGPQLACAACPVFVMFLLRYMSGVPIQEAQALKRWGGQPEYEAYRARTNLLLPLPRLSLGSDPKVS